MIHHVWFWLMNFTGVNNGDNRLATHMYNFWSGFGGNISVLALVGTVIGVYRHNLNRLNAINPLTLVHKLEEIEKEKRSAK